MFYKIFGFALGLFFPRAVVTAFCTSAKVDLLCARHNFLLSGGNNFKAALIKISPTGSYGAASTAYANITGNSDEAAMTGGATGYTAGGPTLTRIDPTSSGTTGFADFANEVITLTGGTSPTFGASGMMIYNDDTITPTADAAVSTHLFSGDPTASGTGATFTITFPTPDASNAIIRLA